MWLQCTFAICSRVIANLINSNCSRSFPNNSWLLPSNVMLRALPGALPNALHILTMLYTTFPLTWPAAWCNCIGTEDWFGSPTWSLFHCLRTPIWRKWPHVKTLFSEGSLLLKKTKYTPRQHLVTYWTQRSHKIWKIEVRNSSLLLSTRHQFSVAVENIKLGKSWWPPGS